MDMPDEDKFQFIIQATVKGSRTGKYETVFLQLQQIILKWMIA